MSDCSALPQQEHDLLRHLTSTAKRRKKARVVVGSPETWSTYLNAAASSLRHVRDDLKHQRYLYEPEPGYIVICEPCRCGSLAKNSAQLQQDVSKPQAKSTKQWGGRPQTGYASMLPSSDDVSSTSLEVCESPGQEPEDEDLEKFLNGAEPGPTKVARRRKKENAYTLGDFFVRRTMAAAKREGITLLPDCVDRAVLGRHLKRYLESEVTPEDLRAMIILFGHRYKKFHKPGADPGRVFLANRRRLLAEVQQQSVYTQERDIDRAAKSGRRYASPDEI